MTEPKKKKNLNTSLNKASQSFNRRREIQMEWLYKFDDDDFEGGDDEDIEDY
ncbi:MAG: hypothetical protein QXH80_04480 [Candidatus Nanoarchaeia archaeon]